MALGGQPLFYSSKLRSYDGTLISTYLRLSMKLA